MIAKRATQKGKPSADSSTSSSKTRASKTRASKTEPLPARGKGSRSGSVPESAPGKSASANPGLLKGKAKLLKAKVSFKGKVFSVSTETVTEPGGVTSTRDVIRHNGSVVILAVDRRENAADPSILIERQYRHAAGKFLLELPAGRMEPGEAPLAAAKRELIEETGYRARRWTRLVRYFASPGFLSEHMQVFLAEDIRPGEAHPEEDEKIDLLPMKLSELLNAIDAGQIEDGKTVISILLFARKEKFPLDADQAV